MRKYLNYLLIYVTILSMSIAGLAHGLGGVTLTAYTGSNVSVDGVIGSSEWSDARHLSFAWASSNSSLTGGGEVWVKNNGTNLLIAVSANGKTNRTSGSDNYYYNLYLLFDDNNDGVIDNNEDAKNEALRFNPSGPFPIYQDLYYDSGLGHYTNDAYLNGTGAGSHTNPGGPGGWVWEFSFPMTSSVPDDLTLPVNGSAGFEIVYSEHYYVGLNRVSSGWAYWQVSYPNGLPNGPTPLANGWANILRTNTPAPISDNTPPTINTPTIQPSSPGPSDQVTVSVLVTDTGSGVKNVSISYTTDDWTSVNQTLLATYDPTSQLATAHIPAQQVGGRVAYYIVAFDNAGNRALNNNVGGYFTYNVPVPWYLNSYNYALIAAALGALLFVGLLLAKRKKPSDRLSH